MAGNTFGKLFQVTTFGESHGPLIGVVVDGCPAGVEIDVAFVQGELDRRRPGQSHLTTARDEKDRVRFQSGIFEGRSTGAPIMAWIANEDQRSADYSHLTETFRPSHADFTYAEKYGVRDPRGGGRSSARETAARVIAGSIAKLFLRQHGIDFFTYVSKVGKIEIEGRPTPKAIRAGDTSPIRCPDADTAAKMIKRIEEVKAAGDTIGGTVSGRIVGLPVGLGEPVFDRLHADLGKAMLSINAVKGFEIGSGFAGVEMRGSEHNDPFVSEDGRVRTTKNDSGGVQGGISNGMDIDFRVAFKPASTLMRSQNSIDAHGNAVELEGKGRHDPCVVPRAVPIVEAMGAITIADNFLRNRAYE